MSLAVATFVINFSIFFTFQALHLAGNILILFTNQTRKQCWLIAGVNGLLHCVRYRAPELVRQVALPARYGISMFEELSGGPYLGNFSVSSKWSLKKGVFP